MSFHTVWKWAFFYGVNQLTFPNLQQQTYVTFWPCRNPMVSTHLRNMRKSNWKHFPTKIRVIIFIISKCVWPPPSSHRESPLWKVPVTCRCQYGREHCFAPDFQDGVALGIPIHPSLYISGLHGCSCFTKKWSALHLVKYMKLIHTSPPWIYSPVSFDHIYLVDQKVRIRPFWNS